MNMLFLDWSVKKVGLKELWTLKFHRTWNIGNQYTMAGVATAEGWPEWMRSFKDYLPQSVRHSVRDQRHQYPY